MSKNIAELLKNNSYPGRGIILGKTPDNKAVAAYFIMGRSENSRNRIFVSTDDGIKTEAFDPSKLSDPSLVIYHPVRRLKNILVVTNGDQTDTIVENLKKGHCFVHALRLRTFEPDPPIFTPRISGVIAFGGDDIAVKLSILKADNNGETTLRQFYEYDGIKPGEGYFIHTYEGDGNPVPSFKGEPVKVEIGDVDEFTDIIWNNLNVDNKVSLYVNTSDLNGENVVELIINKHEQE